MKFFDYANPLEVYHGNLPHWRQHDVPYFVTFRLADSVPESKLRQWRFQRDNWHKAHSKPYTDDELREYHTLFSERIQNWLDAGHGSCLLAKTCVKELVADAMAHFEHERYELDEWIIMPNHVHAIVIPKLGHHLAAILHSWKSYTAHYINKTLRRTGSVWKKETYDHLIRSKKQLEAIRKYIRNNPK